MLRTARVTRYTTGSTSVYRARAPHTPATTRLSRLRRSGRPGYGARRAPTSGPGVGAPEPRRLYRRPDGRLGAGVASGLAEHLGLSPLLLRAAFALLVAAGGAGVLLYADSGTERAVVG